MRTSRLLVASVALSAGTLSGCTFPAKDELRTREQAAMLSAPDLRSVTIQRGSDGSTATWTELLAAAVGAEAVLIGENHYHPRGLAVASALWDDVLECTHTAALGLEFFERQDQLAIDAYLRGGTDENGFRASAKRTDGNYPPGHRAMVEAAREHHRPVIAANAPRSYVRLARTEGFEHLQTLPSEQRSLFRIPDALPGAETRYRQDFDKVMGGNPGGDEAEAKQLDSTFRSQSMWDWTMAESVAKAINIGNSPVVLVVGRFHIDHHGGLVHALEHLRPGTRVVTVSFEDDARESEEAEGRADFVVDVGE